MENSMNKAKWSDLVLKYETSMSIFNETVSRFTLIANNIQNVKGKLENEEDIKMVTSIGASVEAYHTLVNSTILEIMSTMNSVSNILVPKKSKNDIDTDEELEAYLNCDLTLTNARISIDNFAHDVNANLGKLEIDLKGI